MPSIHGQRPTKRSFTALPSASAASAGRKDKWRRWAIYCLAMPGSSKHPLRRRFVVYAIEVGDIPFYIGIGQSEKEVCRSERAEDRVRFVGYMMRREAANRPVKWSMSTRVIAEFFRLKYMPTVRYLHSGLTRKQALLMEWSEITERVSRGELLANRQHNRNYPSSYEAVVRAVLRKSK